MRLVVLDTDVFSFFFKNDTRAALYAPELIDVQPCLSFQTLAELELWTLMRHWGEARRTRLQVVIRQYLLFPYDEGMVASWARITAHRRRLGHEIECGDAWVAASALRHDATLLTHNASDFTGYSRTESRFSRPIAVGEFFPHSGHRSRLARMS